MMSKIGEGAQKFSFLWTSKMNDAWAFVKLFKSLMAIGDYFIFSRKWFIKFSANWHTLMSYTPIVTDPYCCWLYPSDRRECDFSTTTMKVMKIINTIFLIFFSSLGHPRFTVFSPSVSWKRKISFYRKWKYSFEFPSLKSSLFEKIDHRACYAMQVSTNYYRLYRKRSITCDEI